jgi:hypothetical protein
MLHMTGITAMMTLGSLRKQNSSLWFYVLSVYYNYVL